MKNEMKQVMTKKEFNTFGDAKDWNLSEYGSTATSELSEIINRARERGCAEHGHEIKWLLELPMTDDEWKRFNDLTGWSARKRQNEGYTDENNNPYEQGTLAYYLYEAGIYEYFTNN